MDGLFYNYIYHSVNLLTYRQNASTFAAKHENSQTRPTFGPGDWSFVAWITAYPVTNITLCNDSHLFREFQFSFLYTPWLPKPYFFTRLEIGGLGMSLGIFVFFRLLLFILYPFMHGMSVRWGNRHVYHLKLCSHPSAMKFWKGYSSLRNEYSRYILPRVAQNSRNTDQSLEWWDWLIYPVIFPFRMREFNEDNSLCVAQLVPAGRCKWSWAWLKVEVQGVAHTLPISLYFKKVDKAGHAKCT